MVLNRLGFGEKNVCPGASFGLTAKSWPDWDWRPGNGHSSPWL